MILSLLLVIAYVSDGMFDQVKLILNIVQEDLSPFSIFIAILLYFQLFVATSVVSISEQHLFVAYDAKSILIDMFALLLINDVDEYVGKFYMKYEVQCNEEGHEIINDDDWLKFNFTIF